MGQGARGKKKKAKAICEQKSIANPVEECYNQALRSSDLTRRLAWRDRCLI